MCLFNKSSQSSLLLRGLEHTCTCSSEMFGGDLFLKSSKFQVWLIIQQNSTHDKVFNYICYLKSIFQRQQYWAILCVKAKDKEKGKVRRDMSISQNNYPIIIV